MRIHVISLTCVLIMGPKKCKALGGLLRDSTGFLPVFLLSAAARIVEVA